MRLIDADALLDEAMDRYCKECNKRKGIKNGEYRIIYNIGEVPCRACAIDDMKEELEDAQTVDAVPVIRCNDCKYRCETEDGEYNPEDIVCTYWMSDGLNENDYCSAGERKEE